MQPLTPEQAAIITCDSITPDFGCELLGLDLAFREDITDDLLGGGVDRNMHRAPHGQIQLRLARELAWGGPDVVRPYMRLTDNTTGATARWYTGAYILDAPTLPEGTDLPIYSATGKDLTVLLDRPVAADYSVAGGVTYRQGLLDTFTAAGLPSIALIDGSAADDVLPKTRDWLLVPRTTDPNETDQPVTWRQVINDLLGAINFRAVWSDENGRFRCQAYQPTSRRPVEHVFNADDPHVTIVEEGRTLTTDVSRTLNRWVFRQSNRPEGAPLASEGDGIYTYNLPAAHPLSAASRGLVYGDVFDYEAASQAKLVELGDRRVAYDLRVVSSLEVRTGAFPCAGHADLFEFVADGRTRRVQAARWSYDLSGSSVTWEWEVIS